MKKTRRDFIKDMTKSTIGLTLLPSLPWNIALAADEARPKNLIVIRANGGIHPPMGLDPFVLEQIRNRKFDAFDLQDHSEFYAAYGDDDLTRMDNGTLLGVGASPLRRIQDDFVIVSGVMMLPESIGHQPNRRYSTTGSIDVNSKYLPELVQKEVGYQGFGAIQKVIGDGNISNALSSVTLNDFKSLIESDEQALKNVDAVSRLVEARRNSGTIDAPGRTMDALQNEISRLSKSRQYINQIDDAGFDINNELDNEIRYALLGILTETARMSVLDIDFQIDGVGFDTHFDHERNQRIAQGAMFNSIVNLVNTLKRLPGSSENRLYDETIILFVSDFSRTSWKEGTDGASHNPFNNSFLVAGGPFGGGRRVGQSHIFSKAMTGGRESHLSGLPYNFGTNEIVSAELMTKGLADKSFIMGQCEIEDGCVDFIKPADVLWTIAKAMGVQTRPFQLAAAREIFAMRRS